MIPCLGCRPYCLVLVVLGLARFGQGQHLPAGVQDVAVLYKNVKTIFGANAAQGNIRGGVDNGDRTLAHLSNLVKTRCFTECVLQRMTAQACVAYIEQEIAAGGGHEVGTLSIKVKEPRTELEFQASYWMMEVPTNVLGRTTCDRNNGIISYPFFWQGGSGPFMLDDVDCFNLTAGQCCLKMRFYAQQVGRDVNGNCFSCFPHQEPLIPVTTDSGVTVQFEDYLYNGAVCKKETFAEGQVAQFDQALRSQISIGVLNQLNTFLTNPNCSAFGSLLAILYDVSRVIPQLPQLLGLIGCQYCFDSPNIDGLVLDLEKVRSILLSATFDSTERCVIIYTDMNGSILEFPKVGGSRADDPFDDDCPPDVEQDAPVQNGPAVCMTPNEPETLPCKPGYIFDDAIFDYTCVAPTHVDRTELGLDYSVSLESRVVVDALDFNGNVLPGRKKTQFTYHVCTADLGCGVNKDTGAFNFDSLRPIDRVTLNLTGRCVVTDFRYFGFEDSTETSARNDFGFLSTAVSKDSSMCLAGFVWASKWDRVAAFGCIKGSFCRNLMLEVDGDVPAGPTQVGLKVGGGYILFDVDGPICNVCQ